MLRVLVGGPLDGRQSAGPPHRGSQLEVEDFDNPAVKSVYRQDRVGTATNPDGTAITAIRSRFEATVVDGKPEETP